MEYDDQKYLKISSEISWISLLEKIGLVEQRFYGTVHVKVVHGVVQQLDFSDHEIDFVVFCSSQLYGCISDSEYRKGQNSDLVNKQNSLNCFWNAVDFV